MVSQTASSIPEHKQWAVDLSDEEFVREFMRRNPNSDAVPHRQEWLNMPQPAKSRLIDPFVSENIQLETPAQKPKDTIQEKADKTYYCRGHGCERVFHYPIARIAHERRCKMALNTKIPKDKK